MKTICFVTLAAVLVTLPLCAEDVRVTVPFAFTVGNSVAPAGQYLITPIAGSSVVEMTTVGASPYQGRFLAGGGTGVNKSLQPKLVFHVYGERRFLSEVWTRTATMSMPLSRQEREARKATTIARGIVIPIAPGQ